jgi:hypothetical protein
VGCPGGAVGATATGGGALAPTGDGEASGGIDGATVGASVGGAVGAGWPDWTGPGAADGGGLTEPVPDPVVGPLGASLPVPIEADGTFATSDGPGNGTVNVPMPRATLTRMRLTIPSATTRRARWADVTWLPALLSDRHAGGRPRRGWYHRRPW